VEGRVEEPLARYPRALERPPRGLVAGGRADDQAPDPPQERRAARLADAHDGDGDAVPEAGFVPRRHPAAGPFGGAGHQEQLRLPGEDVGIRQGLRPLVEALAAFEDVAVDVDHRSPAHAQQVDDALADELVPHRPAGGCVH
jgi:hypothetical protein